MDQPKQKTKAIPQKNALATWWPLPETIKAKSKKITFVPPDTAVQNTSDLIRCRRAY